MKLSTKLLLALTLFCFQSTLQAQAGPEEKTSKFFMGLSTVGYEIAINEFLADDFLMYKDQLPELKDNFKRIFEEKGKFNGSEFISKEAYGESLIKYKYLCKFDNGPMFASFTYYRPKNRWVVYSFNISPNFE